MEDLHYAEPRLVALYDEQNAGSWDTDFYAALIGAAPLRVLDVGCGTGSFAVRLAAAGHTVTGLDPAPGMLAAARARPGAGAVRWVDGPAEAAPDGPYDVAVMTGHAFQCLPGEDDIRGTLAAVRRRLAPGGRFLFESRNPAARAWLGWDSAEDGPVLSETSAGRVASEWSLLEVAGGEHGAVLVTFEERTRFLADGAAFASRSTLRFTSAARLAVLLAEAGFARVDWFGDWDGGPLDAGASREIIAAASVPA